MTTTEERVRSLTVDECRAREIEPWVGSRAFLYCDIGGDAWCAETGTITGVHYNNRVSFDFGDGGKYCVPVSLVTLPTDDKPWWVQSFVHHPYLACDGVHTWEFISFAVRDTLTGPADELCDPMF